MLDPQVFAAFAGDKVGVKCAFAVTDQPVPLQILQLLRKLLVAGSSHQKLQLLLERYLLNKSTTVHRQRAEAEALEVHSPAETILMCEIFKNMSRLCGLGV